MQLAVLTTNLPVAWDSSVFLRVDEARVDIIKCLVSFIIFLVKPSLFIQAIDHRAGQHTVSIDTLPVMRVQLLIISPRYHNGWCVHLDDQGDTQLTLFFGVKLSVRHFLGTQL